MPWGGGCLRVPPSLAATGFQEMRPVSGALASKGDALTGIKRADSANEIQYSPAKSIDIFCRSFAERDGSIATHLAVDAVTAELN